MDRMKVALQKLSNVLYNMDENYLPLGESHTPATLANPSMW